MKSLAYTLVALFATLAVAHATDAATTDTTTTEKTITQESAELPAEEVAPSSTTVEHTETTKN